MGGWMDGQVDEWVDAWMDGWTSEWMDRASVDQQTPTASFTPSSAALTSFY